MKVHSFKNYHRKKYDVYLRAGRGVMKDFDGLCDDPEEENPGIYLRMGQKDSRLFEVIIHEMAHSFFFDKFETQVDRFSKACVTALKKLGFVIVKKHKPRAKTRSKNRSG